MVSHCLAEGLNGFQTPCKEWQQVAIACGQGGGMVEIAVLQTHGSVEMRYRPEDGAIWVRIRILHALEEKSLRIQPTLEKV